MAMVGALLPILRLNGVGSSAALVTPWVLRCFGETGGYLGHSNLLSDFRTVLLFQDCNPLKLDKLHRCLANPRNLGGETFHLESKSEEALKQQVSVVAALKEQRGCGDAEATSACGALDCPISILLGLSWTNASGTVKRSVPLGW